MPVTKSNLPIFKAGRKSFKVTNLLAVSTPEGEKKVRVHFIDGAAKTFRAIDLNDRSREVREYSFSDIVAVGPVVLRGVEGAEWLKQIAKF